jgi:hypothetical protein
MSSFFSRYINLLDRLRESTGDPKFYAPLDRREGTLASAILFSCYTPFRKSSGIISTPSQVMSGTFTRITSIRPNGTAFRLLVRAMQLNVTRRKF